VGLTPPQLKILLGFFMVAPKVPRIYAIELPQEVRQILSLFDLVIDLDVLNTPLSCLGFGSYLSRLGFWMAAPGGTALVMLLVSAATHRDLSFSAHGPAGYALRVLERAAPWILRMIFLAYPYPRNEPNPCLFPSCSARPMKANEGQ
jgi:hypothetical protein